MLGERLERKRGWKSIPKVFIRPILGAGIKALSVFQPGGAEDKEKSGCNDLPSSLSNVFQAWKAPVLALKWGRVG